jgi:hypothetical protein
VEAEVEIIVKTEVEMVAQRCHLHHDTWSGSYLSSGTARNAIASLVAPDTACPFACCAGTEMVRMLHGGGMCSRRPGSRSSTAPSWSASGTWGMAASKYAYPQTPEVLSRPCPAFCWAVQA